MIDAIAAGITTKFNATGAGSKWSGELYFNHAPQGTTGSYGVFNNITSSKEEFMGAATSGVTTVTFDFMLITDIDTDGDEITDMIDQLNTMYQWQDLTITGFTHIKTQRISIGPTIFEDDKIWSVVVTYEISVQVV